MWKLDQITYPICNEKFMESESLLEAFKDDTKTSSYPIWWGITGTVTYDIGTSAGVHTVTSTEDIGLRTTVWRSPRLIIEPSVRLYERPVLSSRTWALVQGILGNSRRPMSRQSTLPLRYSVRIDYGSPGGGWTTY